MMARTAYRGTVVAALLLVAASCQRQSEIVLVIDTDLSVPVELDQIVIVVQGADQTSQPIAVDLTAAGAPGFPLTLGLVSAGASSPVVVGVVGNARGIEVVHQDVQTAFVEGQSRMLRVLLVRSCVNMTCPTDQTCGSDGCGPRDRPGDLLPPWTGVVPPKPVTITPVEGRTVWASGWHSCAIVGGTLYGWGQNADGQLGNGTTQNAPSRRLVMTLQDPIAVGLGDYHSCACDKSKQAWCWGRNAEGQLGTGNVTASSVPIPVPGVTDCEQITGGGHHTCVLRSDRTVSCWGQNTSGQIGLTASTTPATTPQAVPNLTDVAEVGGGELYTCARRNDGTIVCWGDNKLGELGDGTMMTRATPAPVLGLTADIAELVTGRFSACVRHSTGLVSCWGNNGVGQLGVSSPMTSSVPLDVPGILDATQLALGQQHACVIRRTGVLSCWGGNQSGQLGDGTVANSPTPVDVLQIAGVTSVATGSIHTCARHSTGLSCWGDNLVNQLGDGSVTNRSTPVSVAGF